LKFEETERIEVTFRPSNEEELLREVCVTREPVKQEVGEPIGEEADLEEDLDEAIKRAAEKTAQKTLDEAVRKAIEDNAEATVESESEQKGFENYTEFEKSVEFADKPSTDFVADDGDMTSSVKTNQPESVRIEIEEAVLVETENEEQHWSESQNQEFEPVCIEGQEVVEREEIVETQSERKEAGDSGSEQGDFVVYARHGEGENEVAEVKRKV